MRKKSKKKKLTQPIKKGSPSALILDKTIHEPNRLRLMAQLFVVEIVDMNYLKKELDLTWGNLSSHLSRLESVGYVSVKKEFIEKKPRTTVQLTILGREQFMSYRKHMKTLLE